MRTGSGAGILTISRSWHGDDKAEYFWLFPNLMLNLYPDNLQTNVIVPLGVDRTITRFEWYVLDPNSPGVAEEFARSFAFSDLVQKEDIGICEAVQQGLKSRAYRAGRLSVRREAGEHLFHRLLAADLKAGVGQAASAAD